MIRSFNNLVEMKNKVILKMNKHNLAVNYFLRFLYGENLQNTIKRNRIIDTTNTKRKTGNSDISEYIGKYAIRVIIRFTIYILKIRMVRKIFLTMFEMCVHDI